jgi:hypothetical protein
VGHTRSARLAVATARWDVTGKQRFDSDPAVSSARRRDGERADGAASNESRARTHGPYGRGIEVPAHGRNLLGRGLVRGESRVKRTVYEKNTRGNPSSEAGVSFLPGACGARATNPKIFSAERSRELKRICFWSVVVESAELNGELAAWSG